LVVTVLCTRRGENNFTQFVSESETDSTDSVAHIFSLNVDGSV